MSHAQWVETYKDIFLPKQGQALLSFNVSLTFSRVLLKTQIQGHSLVLPSFQKGKYGLIQIMQISLNYLNMITVCVDSFYH